MSRILEVVRVSKEFPDRETHALDSVSFELGTGEVVALVGPNGAGKTTLMKVILDLLPPSVGEVRLFGLANNDAGWKQDVGYLPESFHVGSVFTGEGFLRHIGQLRNLSGSRLDERVASRLHQFGLSEHKAVLVSRYCKGMMARLGLAQAVLHDPRLLILDGPADGLDDQGRQAMEMLLQEFRAKGGSVLLISQHLSDVEMAADRMIILQAGRIHGVVKPQGAAPQQHRVITNEPTP